MNYNGPVAGYTNEEMAEVFGKAILKIIDENDMQIVWKRKE